MNRSNLFSPNRTMNINNNNITTLEELRVSPSPNAITISRFPENDSSLIMQEYLKDHNMTIYQFVSEARSISSNSSELGINPESILLSLDNNVPDGASQSDNNDSTNVNHVDRIIRSSLAVGQRLAQVASLSESENVSQHVHEAVDNVVKNTAEFIASNSKSSVSTGSLIMAGAAAVIAGGAIYYTLGKLPFRLLPNISSLLSSSSGSSSDSQQTISLPVSSSEKVNSGFHITTFTLRKIFKLTFWLDNSNK